MTLVLAGVAFTLGVVGPMLAPQVDTIYKPGNGVSAPKLVTDVKPQYPPDAMRRRVTGAVLLRCVVDREGVPTSLEVVRPLDEDLDRVALEAFREWRFEPGTKDGRPVFVQIEVEMVFSIGKRNRWGWLNPTRWSKD